MSQRGFIPILAVAMISIVAASGAITGIVLHRQGKLTPLVANISEVFRAAKYEPEEIKEPPKEINNQPQPYNEDAQVRIQELEQKIKKLEKRQPTPPQLPPVEISPIPQPQPAPLSQEDSALKVARCQAEAREKVDRLINQALSSYLPLFQQRLDKAHAEWVKARQEQIRRSMETPSELIGAHPYTQSQARDAAAQAMQPTVDYYANLENQIADQWEQAKREARRIGELQYNSLYLECLNK